VWGIYSHGASGGGVITEAVRDEQRKFIKYNHLVANLLAFHTLVTMSKALYQLVQDGHTIDMNALSTSSPYRPDYINRFGNYVVNSNRIPEPLEEHLWHPFPPIPD